MKLLAYFCNNSIFNKIFFITFVAVINFSSSNVIAQERDGTRGRRNFDKESFLVKRSAFITAELGLTTDEAATFIPLCEEMQRKKFEAGEACRKLDRQIRANNDLTDADYLKAIDECISVSAKEAALEKEYYEKFKKILSPEKLYKYRYAEMKFAREFMRSSGDRDVRNKDK